LEVRYILQAGDFKNTCGTSRNGILVTSDLSTDKI